MKEILECDIKSFSHYNYLTFKRGKYLLTNSVHHYGNLEFKFDDSDLKKIKYQSIDEILFKLSNKSLLKKEDIYEKFKSEIQDQFEYNSSKYISKKIGQSLVSKIASKFYYNENFEYYCQMVDCNNSFNKEKSGNKL